MRKNDNPGYLPGSLPRAALCVALSSVLALGFTAGQLANPPQAHAVAPLAIPAGAAAMGLGVEEALAAFAALGAVTCGWSLSSYVGAPSNDIDLWTDEEKDKAIDQLGQWLDRARTTDPDAVQRWIEEGAKVEEGSVKPGPSGGGPSKDPNDYDNNVGWMVLTLLNCSSLATSALGFFADGIKNLMSLNGSLEEIDSYPDLSIDFNGKDAVFSVVPYSSFSEFSYSNIPTYVEPLESHYVYKTDGWTTDESRVVVTPQFYGPGTVTGAEIYYNGAAYYLRISFSEKSGGAYPQRSFGSSSTGRWYSNIYGWSDFTTLPLFDKSGVLQLSSGYAISPDIALLLDKTYTNTTQLDNRHEIADAPQAISGLDIDTIKDYLNQIATNPSTGTYTYVKPTTTVVRNTYNDNLEETKTKPEEVSPKPDEPSTPGLTVPDDYHFPDSWTDGSLKLNRMFPFFFFDDMYTIYRTWFPESAYDSKLRISIPGVMWGKPNSSEVLVIDFSPWEKYRDIVYYGFLALVMFGFLARLFEWWGGFAMRMDGDS